ncbi:MAG: DNA-binding protein [Burkholderiales bacterium]|jgi:chromosome segregation ATPase|nr:DNA-binding protein [Burkholderiales bacterium]
MARAGIYKSEVIKARNNLLATGRYPSIDAIRSELGNTGSKGTIHRFVKEIEEEGGGTGAKIAVSEAIQDLTTRLAERLHQESDQRIVELVEKHKAEISALNDIIDALRNEVDSFRSQSERLVMEMTTEKASHAKTMNELQEERIVQAQTAQRIQDMEQQQAREEAHRVSLEEKHLHAREALEHFRVAAKEQREQDQRQFEQQIQFLQTELRAAKETATVKRQELIRSHEDNVRLSSELAHFRSELHRLETEARPLRAAREQLAVSELKRQQVEEQLLHTGVRVDELLIEIQGYEKKLQEATQTTFRLEAELTAMKAVSVSQEQVLQKLIANHSPPAKGSEQKSGVSENQGSLLSSDNPC